MSHHAQLVHFQWSGHQAVSEPAPVALLYKWSSFQTQNANFSSEEQRFSASCSFAMWDIWQRVQAFWVVTTARGQGESKDAAEHRAGPGTGLLFLFLFVCFLILFSQSKRGKELGMANKMGSWGVCQVLPDIFPLCASISSSVTCRDEMRCSPRSVLSSYPQWEVAPCPASQADSSFVFLFLSTGLQIHASPTSPVALFLSLSQNPRD